MVFVPEPQPASVPSHDLSRAVKKKKKSQLPIRRFGSIEERKIEDCYLITAGHGLVCTENAGVSINEARNEVPIRKILEEVLEDGMENAAEKRRFVCWSEGLGFDVDSASPLPQGLADEIIYTVSYIS